MLNQQYQRTENILHTLNIGEWDHSISTTVKEGPADCIRME